MVLHPLQNRKFPSIYIKPGIFNSVHLYECNTPQKITECSNLSLKLSDDREFKLHVYVVVQFYPWFKFYFPLF